MTRPKEKYKKLSYFTLKQKGQLKQQILFKGITDRLGEVDWKITYSTNNSFVLLARHNVGLPVIFVVATEIDWVRFFTEDREQCLCTIIR